MRTFIRAFPSSPISHDSRENSGKTSFRRYPGLWPEKRGDGTLITITVTTNCLSSSVFSWKRWQPAAGRRYRPLFLRLRPPDALSCKWHVLRNKGRLCPVSVARVFSFIFYFFGVSVREVAVYLCGVLVWLMFRFWMFLVWGLDLWCLFGIFMSFSMLI